MTTRTTVGGRSCPLTAHSEYEDLPKGDGNIYFNSRYYDPLTGRFLTEDPARKGVNWYAYCENDPINKTDPDGRDPSQRTSSAANTTLELAKAATEGVAGGLGAAEKTFGRAAGAAAEAGRSYARASQEALYAAQKASTTSEQKANVAEYRAAGAQSRSAFGESVTKGILAENVGRLGTTLTIVGVATAAVDVAVTTATSGPRAGLREGLKQGIAGVFGGIVAAALTPALGPLGGLLEGATASNIASNVMTDILRW